MHTAREAMLAYKVTLISDGQRVTVIGAVVAIGEGLSPSQLGEVGRKVVWMAILELG